MELERKVSAIVLSGAKIEALRMPENVKKVFLVLGKEKNIDVKGGHAKLLFQVLLRQWGEIKGNRNCRAQGYDGAPFDLDLLINYESPFNLSELDEQVVKKITEKLQSKDVELKGKNIETRQVTTDENSINDYLRRQDLTINEVIASSIGNGSWKLYFTDKCQRDTINGAGILSPKGQGTVRRHNGAMIASQKGIVRLIQALIESKVRSIYLPQWWIDVNNEEVQRLFKKDLKFRENLGYYGYLICQRYIRNKTLQVKLMEILKMLQLTDFDKDEFAEFYNEQSNAAKLFNGDFRYNPNMSFTENQERLIEDKRRKKESKQEAKI